jgi:hypothetical protein
MRRGRRMPHEVPIPQRIGRWMDPGCRSTPTPGEVARLLAVVGGGPVRLPVHVRRPPVTYAAAAAWPDSGPPRVDSGPAAASWRAARRARRRRPGAHPRRPAPPARLRPGGVDGGPPSPGPGSWYGLPSGPMSDDPRDSSGAPLCAWCGGPVPPSRGTKPRSYCKRGCVQRAHEARKLADLLAKTRSEARAAEAAVWSGKSRDLDGKSRDDAHGKSRDFPEPPAERPASGRS